MPPATDCSELQSVAGETTKEASNGLAATIF